MFVTMTISLCLITMPCGLVGLVPSFQTEVMVSLQSNSEKRCSVFFLNIVFTYQAILRHILNVKKSLYLMCFQI